MDRGFSLIEVTIAIALLAGVLVSIASMFVLAARQLKSARVMTIATAVAEDLMESFKREPFSSLYLGLGASPSDTTWTVDTGVDGGPLASWRREVARRLERGVASVTVEAVGPGAPTFGDAIGIRLTVRVSWDEAGRAGSVTLATVRF